MDRVSCIAEDRVAATVMFDYQGQLDAPPQNIWNTAPTAAPASLPNRFSHPCPYTEYLSHCDSRDPLMIPTNAMEKHKCELCSLFEEMNQDEDWMFNWISDLKEWQRYEENNAKSRSFEFSPFNIDDKVWKIREKLADLQMKMPAWSYVHCIVKRAHVRAIDARRQLEKGLNAVEATAQEGSAAERSQDTSKPNTTVRTQDEEFQKLTKWMLRNTTHEKQMLESVPTEVYREKMLNEAEVKKLELQKVNIQKALTSFVSTHVAQMLEQLQQQLFCASEYSESNQKHELKEKIRRLYTVNDEVCLVGPVGERPIHVCALLAAKFSKAYDFEGQGNYVTDGILDGMQSFLAKDNYRWWREAWVGYGKDYCAVVGTKYADNSKEVLNKLPLLDDLRLWYDQHAKASPDPPPRTVTLGLYEGESILYPLISSGAEDAIKDLLEMEATYCRSRESQPHFLTGCLTNIHAKGLFFRPMHKQWLTTCSLVKGWEMYRQSRPIDSNPHASSPKSYFGLTLLSFAASQGQVGIFDILLKNTEERWHHLLQQQVRSHTSQPNGDQSKQDSRTKHYMFAEALKEGLRSVCMANEWEKKLQKRELEGEVAKAQQQGELAKALQAFCAWKVSDFCDLAQDFVRKGILNGVDEFGNTALHLAAWNDQQEMYSWLVRLGVDERAENNDGLTAFTLTARFGIWGTFNHIWDKHLTDTVWRFGNMEARSVDYSQFDWKALGSFTTAQDFIICVDSLIWVYVKEELKIKANARPSWESMLDKDSKWKARESMVMSKVERWADGVLKDMIDDQVKGENQVATGDNQIASSGKQRGGGGGGRNRALKAPGSSNHRSVYEEHFMSAIRLITLFRPDQWYLHARDKVEKVVLEKWGKGYFIVHLGNSVFPFFVQHLLFGLMWWKRELNIVDHSFWWSNDTVSAPNLNPSLESSCGWPAIRDSTSGQLQAAMVIYGVPSLIRLAYSQHRLRASDLDENEDMVITMDEVINFIYFNLETLFHFVTAGLFIVIGVARVAAGEQCALASLRTEKNCTAIAALVLFWNLFILAKPYKAIGLLVLSTYRFLTKEVLNFIIMYSIFFVAFLMALQTLHNANHAFLHWMDYDHTILSRVHAAQNLTYLVNQNIPQSDQQQLLSTYTALNGCQKTAHTMYDTAFSLLEISFGDGLSDALIQVGFIIVLWVFLTNILVLNMLIAMMSFMFEEQIRHVHSVWLLDVSFRVFRYERRFPEVTAWIAQRGSSSSIWTRAFWWDLLSSTALMCYCVPEVHWRGWSHRLVVILRHRMWGCSSGGGDARAKWVPIIDEVQKEALERAEEQNSSKGVAAHVGRVFDRARRRSFIQRLQDWEKVIKDKGGTPTEEAELTQMRTRILVVTMVHWLEGLSAVSLDASRTYSTHRLTNGPDASSQ